MMHMPESFRRLKSSINRRLHRKGKAVVSNNITTTTGSEPLTQEAVEVQVPKKERLSPNCPVFALIIGIDKYERSTDPHISSPRNLKGSVNDSNDFHTYLTGALKVPEDHIRVLQDEAATRDAILDAFDTHFIRNETIENGDCIILFFAGHGGRQQAPPNMYSEERMVETLCPHDVCNKSGIPDYSLSCKLRQLATSKGDNIVMILDSCHSGGMGRDQESARCYDPPQPLPPLPLDLPSDDSRDDHSIYRPDEAFVLLAACQAREYAREHQAEDRFSGAFTKVLIKSLTDWDLSVSGRLTYARLIENLPSLDDQHPHCEGRNRIRRLFDASNEGGDDPNSFVVTQLEKDGPYYVSAGWFHGVVIGTEFLSTSAEQKPLRLVVDRTEEFRSLVVPDPPDTGNILPLHSRVIVSKWQTKWLKVELVPPGFLPSDLETEDDLFTLGESKALSELKVVQVDEKTVHVERGHNILFKHIDVHPVSVERTSITTAFLNRMAHFSFFLQIQSSNTLNVSVQLHQVVMGKDNVFSPLDPDKNRDANLFKPIQSVSEVSEAILPPSNDLYGVTIQNNSDLDLFPYVFFLDPTSYTIQKLYIPASPLHPPLKRKGSSAPTLSIGYGTPSAIPWQFTDLPPGVGQDSGFLRVFVSQTYVNMDGFETPPPTSGRLGVIAQQSKAFAKCWDSFTHIVTVKRDYSLIRP